MKTLVVSIATLALIAGPATMVSAAATKDAPVLVKASAPSCASAKPVKLAKPARVENRCVSDGPHGVGVVPLVLGGAIVAGVVAVAVTNNDNNPTSP